MKLTTILVLGTAPLTSSFAPSFIKPTFSSSPARSSNPHISSSSLDAFSLKRLFRVGGSHTDDTARSGSVTATTPDVSMAVGLTEAYATGDGFMDAQLAEVRGQYAFLSVPRLLSLLVISCA